MKLSEQWLQEWLGAEVDSELLLERLTMSGLEVDGLEAAAAEFSNVVVARVISVEPHPDADKLSVCQVESGEGEPLQIVCGASNVKPGLVTALARIGASLPGGFKIKKSKLRGVESFGMLCSARELGLAEDAEGLLELPDDLETGQDIRDALFLNDNIIELSITPNRGDCFSIAGIARDVSVFCNVPYKAHEFENIPHSISDQKNIQLNAPEACPAYAGRIIKGVKTSAPTPLWMIEKLRRSGIRSISAVVDISNYVMLELGQPMHAFDLAKLNGDICVRYANNKEKLTLLDGESHELDDKTLVIADADKAVAMAGIMGGLDSAVGDDTQDIFLESAFFTPELIIGDARRYGLHTDSSHRFERGVDFELHLLAIERATSLIMSICGGEAGPVSAERSSEHLPKRSQVSLRQARIKRLLGIEVEASEVEEILKKLGLDVEPTEQGWNVTPPSYRYDIALEVDLIEEIARTIGYDNIQADSLSAHIQLKNTDSRQSGLEQARSLLVNRGYQEAITYSFISEQSNAVFKGQSASLQLSNPISSELSVMRSSLIPGLLEAVQYNLNRQQNRVRLFESGLSFNLGKELKQSLKIAAIATGEIEPEQWDTKQSSCDYYDIKGDVEALLRLQSSSKAVKFMASEHEFLHPGQSSDIYIENQYVGFVGVLHPSLLKQYGLETAPVFFELDIEHIFDENVVKFSEISKFPSIRRDISILVDENISYEKIHACIKKSAPDLLTNLELFDLYQGEHIDIGKKSLTFGLTFQGSSSTLTDTEVESLKDNVLNSLRNELGATLRE